MISDTIELKNRVSGTLDSIINKIDKTVNSMDKLERVEVSPENFVETSKQIDELQSELNKVINIVKQPIDIKVNTESSQKEVKAVKEALEELQHKVPDMVNLSNMETPVFNTVGMDRFNKEMQDAVRLSEQIASNQKGISSSVSSSKVISNSSIAELNALSERINQIKERISQLNSNALDMDADTASAEIERLRELLNSCIQEQNMLNSAIKRGDASKITNSFNRLNSNVKNTEKYIRDNVKGQRDFTEEVKRSNTSTLGLGNSLRGILSTLMAVLGVKDTIEKSDNLSQLRARLDNCNDGLQTTTQLLEMVKAVSNDTRSDMFATGSTIAKLATSAKDAFGSVKEIYAFTSLINKSLVVGGASAEESKSALLQLAQGLSSGQLQGDEFRSIAENAPMILDYVAKYLGKTRAEVKKLSSDGEITASVIKGAVFANAEDINAKFENMPYTWAQCMTIFKNKSIDAMEPLLKKISELANDDEFTEGLESLLSFFVLIADVGVDGLKLLAKGAKTVKENYQAIEPILSILISGLVTYKLASLGVAGAKLAEKTATDMLATSQAILNGEKLTGIMISNLAVLAVVAVVAAIYLTVAAINKATGASISAGGVVLGTLNVLKVEVENCGKFILNTFEGVAGANIALLHNVLAAIHNFINDVKIGINNLASNGMEVVLGLINLINKIPHVNIDTSGIKGKIEEYKAKVKLYTDDKTDYMDISDAFIDRFGNRELTPMNEAFDAGYNFVTNLKSKLKNIVDPNKYNDILSDLDKITEEAGKTSANTKETAKNTKDITKTDIKYLNEMFKQQIDNRVTNMYVTNNLESKSSGTNGYREQLSMAKMLATHSKKSLTSTLKKAAARG